MNSIRERLSRLSLPLTSRLRFGVALPALVILTWGCVANAATPTLPAAVVGNVTASSSATASMPVVRATRGVQVAATVTPTFDSSSGPTTVQTSCSSCSKGDSFCGTQNTLVKSKQVLTTTAINVSNTMTV